MVHREIISVTFWLDSLGFTVLKRVREQLSLIFSVTAKQQRSWFYQELSLSRHNK